MGTNPNDEDQGIYYSPAGLWQAGLNWFERYEMIEQHVLAHPGLPEDQLAVQLGVDAETIQQAMKVLRVLNDNSRRLICENLSQDKAPVISSNN
jgi:hypothetical protein